MQRPEIKGAKDQTSRVLALYKLLFDRAPDTTEMAVASGYLKLGENQVVAQPTGPWQYGFGGYDASTKKVAFTPFTTFDGTGYHFSSTFPDPQQGYMVLNSVGGHPGHDDRHAVIRRWVAPVSGTYVVDGLLVHRQAQGDGIRARIVSGNGEMLGEWTAHNHAEATNLTSVTLAKGETLDFVIEPTATDNFDSFEWTPTVRTSDSSMTWNARKDFGPPPPAPLNRLVLYAQALMMTNEFVFVD